MNKGGDVSVSLLRFMPESSISLGATLPAVFLLLFLLMTQSWQSKQRTLSPGKKPPAYRSYVPVIGNALSLIWDYPALLGRVIKASRNVPTRLNLLAVEFYVISGTEATAALWKRRDVHVRAYKQISVCSMLNMPKTTLDLWLADDSGIGHTPHPQSNVAPHLRIEYMSHLSLQHLMTGPLLKGFAQRFISNMRQEQTDLERDLAHSWKDIDDLWDFVTEKSTRALVISMCGEELTKLCPSFIQDFWAYNEVIYYTAKGYPRWLNAQPYVLRDKCHNSLKQWYQSVKRYLDDDGLAGKEWNPLYGSPLFRDRHKTIYSMEKNNDDAAAADVFGIVMATSGNSVATTYWMLAHILLKPHLLSMFKARLSIYRTGTTQGCTDFDFDSMSKDNLIQALYAETMRLRAATFMLRSPEHDNFQLGQYHIPKNALMLISNYHMHMNESVWDPSGTMPVKEFWPERFLQTATGHQVLNLRDLDINALDTLSYSLGDRASWWLPYGGGIHACPGRIFAKQQMIMSTAVLLAKYDIELLDKALPTTDAKSLGFGARPPTSKLRARMRRAASQ